MTDDDDTLPDRYTERAAETLAYRLMEYLEFLGVLTADHVAYLRWPPIELIEDAEKEMASEQIAESANCSNCEYTKQELSDFRQEVSDEVSALCLGIVPARLKHLIIPAPKPDPLVEVMKDAGWADAVIASCAPSLSAALDARGLEIREKNDDQ